MQRHHRLLAEIRLFIGFSRNSTSTKEKFVSGTTGLLGIGIVYLAGMLLGEYAFDGQDNRLSDAFMLIPIAASAVLLFCVPHGALSQPWPVIGGNTVSAVIGVICSQHIASPSISASVAVGGAILVMQFLRCIHPPGGATALSAVLGGEAIQKLGYDFVIFPVFFSAVLMVILATVLNYPFQWRRYPSHLFHSQNDLQRIAPDQRTSEITLEDFIAAVNQHDSYIDVTEESWIELFELAKQNAEKGIEHPEEIVTGSYYSNGQLGRSWEIRQVVRKEFNKQKQAHITYIKVSDTPTTLEKHCSLETFRQWARFEVSKTNGYWERA
ncbi:HPP family protein [Alteromonas sp. ASW11-19]|uniref:HPP family protein n=1 Tax=Alteromonas salexigens TaxID=2982530 RepID=A0ABT2VRW0_9ALTE|nr:HPP family protein [Alteromonas salexigens]MCU7556038.1 HPP family protein [Alteromonas salexigens]